LDENSLTVRIRSWTRQRLPLPLAARNRRTDAEQIGFAIVVREIVRITAAPHVLAWTHPVASGSTGSSTCAACANPTR